MIKRTTETLSMRPSEKCVLRRMYLEFDKPIDMVALKYALIMTCPDAAIADPTHEYFIGNKNAASIKFGRALGEFYQQDDMPKNFGEFKKSPYVDGILTIGKIRCYSYGNPRFNNIISLVGEVQSGEVVAMKEIVDSIQNAESVYNEAYIEPNQLPYEVVSVLGYAFDRYEDLHIHYSASLPLCLVYRFLEDLLKRDEIADYHISAVIDTGKNLEAIDTIAKDFKNKLRGKKIESVVLRAQNDHIRIFIDGADCNNVRIFVKSEEDDFFVSL